MKKGVDKLGRAEEDVRAAMKSGKVVGPPVEVFRSGDVQERGQSTF